MTCNWDLCAFLSPVLERSFVRAYTHGYSLMGIHDQWAREQTQHRMIPNDASKQPYLLNAHRHESRRDRALPRLRAL